MQEFNVSFDKYKTMGCPLDNYQCLLYPLINYHFIFDNIFENIKIKNN